MKRQNVRKKMEMGVKMWSDQLPWVMKSDSQNWNRGATLCHWYAPILDKLENEPVSQSDTSTNLTKHVIFKHSTLYSS